MEKLRNGQYVFSPSDLIRFMESAFVTWMDRFDKEYPGEFTRDEPNAGDTIVQEKGMQHERDFLKTLQDSYDVCDLTDVKDRKAATLDAMREGRKVIYQAALSDGVFSGYADFLFAVEGESELGEYHYEPWDTKLALRPKPYFLVQLACYSDLLKISQGRLPSFMHVVLGDEKQQTYRTQDFIYYYRQLRQAFLEQQQRFDRNDPPEFSGKEEFRHWQTHAEKIIADTDHLCQVAHIRTTQMRKLRNVGINTMSDLGATEKETVPRLQSDTFRVLKWQARLQTESKQLPKPAWEPIRPHQPGLGLHLLPPAAPSDVFFDMEGYPLVEGGLEYLFGAIILENGKPDFVDWWAHSHDEEKLAFEQFMDWLYARWKKDPSMHVYHYAAYEKSALRKLSSRYSTRQDEVDDLLRNEVFVDLFTVTRQSIKVGTPNYSIKSIERLYRAKRAGDVSTAVDSIVYYQRWIEGNDGPDWNSSTILKLIRDYNIEDCESTLELATWLRSLQAQEGVVWQQREQKAPPTGEQAQFRSKASALAVEMLRDIPTQEEEKSAEDRVKELLAQLLEFHWREEKPVHWTKFDRHAMTEQELFDDPGCLAGMERVGESRKVDKSYCYDYRFDPNQDTKIDGGDDCFYAHDLNQEVRVVSIDSDLGCITLKRSAAKGAPPDRLSLIKNEHITAMPIAKSIFRSVDRYAKDGTLPSALRDLLERKRPRIHGSPFGPLITGSAESLVDETKDLLLRMDGTTVCIQGPPGSGKTYAAAQAIVHLLRNGKRIGVTSNSHKAIAHLMDKVVEQAQSTGLDVQAVKLQSEMSQFHITAASVKPMVPSSFFESPNDWQLIGGTAWAWSNESAAGLLDYLFVDEAGQVSVANLVGMAASASNIVLVGDQMQLSQPLQGTHPGASGKSVLEYLLQDRQVIPVDFGIFLGESRRMHPNVCSFISGAVYEDRLNAHPHTSLRALSVPSGPTEFLTKNSGILYVPVEHDGNMQDSEEEAETVARIVRELEQCTLSIDKRERRFSLERDVLIVAPYNMQVRKLRQRLPGAQVGSVDKFQGQEAPIVIISMCSSTGDASPRGLEFIFSKNRLNVAISRAQILAVVVGSPALARTHCTRVGQMELVNLFCRIVGQGTQPVPSPQVV